MCHQNKRPRNPSSQPGAMGQSCVMTEAIVEGKTSLRRHALGRCEAEGQAAPPFVRTAYTCVNLPIPRNSTVIQSAGVLSVGEVAIDKINTRPE